MWVRVFANDTEDPIFLESEDLHPASRLRRTIESEVTTQKHYVNITRDVVLSMIASQRHNRVLCKGACTEQELLYELDRDCVDVGVSVLHLEDDDVQEVVRFARKLVSAILNWPRLQESLTGPVKGRVCDWASGPLHVYVRLSAKTNHTSLESRNQMLRCVLAHVMLKENESASYADWWLVKENVNSAYSMVRIAMSTYDPWLVLCDSNRTSSEVVRICNHINDAADRGDIVAIDLLRKVSNLVGNIPNASQVFGPNEDVPEFEILKAAFCERGWTCTMASEDDCVPSIVFPTGFLRPAFRVQTGPTLSLVRVLGGVQTV